MNHSLGNTTTIKHGQWYRLTDGNEFGSTFTTYCMQVEGGVVMKNVTIATSDNGGSMLSPGGSSESLVFIPGNSIVDGDIRGTCKLHRTKHG